VARVVWGTFGEKFYEVGVDRGVLYVANSGYAWNGLTTVTESPSGGEPQPVYIDGVKVINVASSEEFAATVEALNSPAEFAQCDGTVGIQNGLFVTQQPRKQFGLSYRTMVGNDAVGQYGAYKIHIVYNALAGPSQRTRNTMGGNIDLTQFSWEITTLPPIVTGYRPTAHFVIDSRSTPEELLASVEDILYGSEVADATLPSAQDLIAMFTA
jgi:hypothetical protein